MAKEHTTKCPKQKGQLGELPKWTPEPSRTGAQWFHSALPSTVAPHMSAIAPTDAVIFHLQMFGLSLSVFECNRNCAVFSLPERNQLKVGKFCFGSWVQSSQADISWPSCVKVVNHRGSMWQGEAAPHPWVGASKEIEWRGYGLIILLKGTATLSYLDSILQVLAPHVEP